MDFVAGAIQEAGIDKDHPFADGADAFLEVDGGAPFLVHDADFQGIPRHAEGVFHPAEQVIGKGRFLRTVHLRFDDIHRPGAAVTEFALALEVMDGNQTGDQGIENAFRHLGPVPVQHRVVGHQVADVTDQEQTAPRQGQLTAARGLIGAVGVEPPGH